MNMYDPKYWKHGENITVEQFCDYLKKNISAKAIVHVCGCDEFYTHLSEDGSLFTVDNCALFDLEEYDGYNPQNIRLEE